LSVQSVSKISNLCGPDPPTSPTDGQTDDMQSQYRALHYSASRDKKNCRPRPIGITLQARPVGKISLAYLYAMTVL